MVDRLEEMITRQGFPGRDRYQLPPSQLTFQDGAQYRMEISGIDSLEEMEALVEEKNKRKVPIHRVISMGTGTHLLTSSELRDLAQMGKEGGIEVIVLPGPRANYDLGKHASSPWGKVSGVRVRGADQMRYFLQDVVRCIEAGLRGFLFYGEDLLYLFHLMRQAGDLPEDLVFKVSYTQGLSNPAGAKLLQKLGADSVNPVTDLTLPMLAAIREVLSIPLDVVVASFDILGEINRFWETPEMIRVCSPIYLKQELESTVENARQKVRYCEVIQEIVDRSGLDLQLSADAPEDLRIPRP